MMRRVGTVPVNEQLGISVCYPNNKVMLLDSSSVRLAKSVVVPPLMEVATYWKLGVAQAEDSCSSYQSAVVELYLLLGCVHWCSEHRQNHRWSTRDWTWRVSKTPCQHKLHQDDLLLFPHSHLHTYNHHHTYWLDYSAWSTGMHLIWSYFHHV